MSQPRRKRRRRRRRGGPRRDATPQPTTGQPQREAVGEAEAATGAGRRRRRRRHARKTAERPFESPKLSEDLVRAPERKRRTALTRPHDGTTLEQVIGELQSTWGVPQNPQEFRITVKIAEPRVGRGEDEVDNGRADEGADVSEGRPRREKAPAAPRIGAASEAAPSADDAGRRRRRRRRRGRGRG